MTSKQRVAGGSINTTIKSSRPRLTSVEQMHVHRNPEWLALGNAGAGRRSPRPTTDNLTVLQFKCRIHFIGGPVRCVDVIMSFAFIIWIRG